jgi:hypothetical protein
MLNKHTFSLLIGTAEGILISYHKLKHEETEPPIDGSYIKSKSQEQILVEQQ